MKRTSEAYQEAIKRGFRSGISYARVYFTNIDVEAANDGAWSSSGEAWWSETGTLAHPYAYAETVATLEHNRWVLDGTQVIADPEAEWADGFVSDSVSGRNGMFAAVPTLTFSMRSAHTFRSLTVTFDTRANASPRVVTAIYYLNGNAVGSETVSLEGVVAEIPNRSVDVDEVRIRFDEMPPYRRPRVQYVMFGRIVLFENGDLLSLQQKHDVDPLSRRVPSERFEFTILDYQQRYNPDNPEGDYAYVDEKSPISVQYGYTLPDGEVEWIEPSRYLLTGKPTVSPNRATFRATGLVESMGGTYYKSKVGEKTLYDMAVDVLLDAGLEPTISGGNPWVVSDALKEMTTTAVLPIASHATCLQMIAHAARCRLYTDNNNVVHMEPFLFRVKDIFSGYYYDAGHFWFSEWDSLEEPKQSGVTFATFERNRWVLDGGSQVIAAKTDFEKTGYTSSAISGQRGSVADGFGKVLDTPRDMEVIHLTFDPVLGWYPDEVIVTYESYRGNILDTQTIRPTKAEVKIRSKKAHGVRLVLFTFIWSFPERRARVSKIRYRETDFSLTFHDMIGGNYQLISKIDQLKAVTVAKYQYQPEAGGFEQLPDADVVYW